MTVDEQFWRRVDLGRVREVLEELVPEADWDAPHMKKTPERFAKMIHELTTPNDFEFTVFDNDNEVSDMVIQGPIPFHSLCAHHVVPFVGNAWVAYIPEERIVGLSKLARAVKSMSQSLWEQEQLTHAIAEYINDQLEPKGLGVVMQAEHMCMTIRGVQSVGTLTMTSAMRGVFLDPDKGARDEFLRLIEKAR